MEAEAGGRDDGTAPQSVVTMDIGHPGPWHSARTHKAVCTGLEELCLTQDRCWGALQSESISRAYNSPPVKLRRFSRALGQPAASRGMERASRGA